MKVRVLLLDGESVKSFDIAQCLAEPGDFEIHVLASDNHAPLRLSRRCASFRTHAGWRADDTLEAVLYAVRQTGANIALPIMSPAIRFCAEHSEMLGGAVHLPPVPETSSFDIVRDKWAFAQFLHRHSLPHPPTIMWASQEWPEGDDILPFPVLLKPSHGSGGKGIRLLEDREALRALKDGCGELRQPHVIQSYIRGRDVDCSVLCRNGRILAHTIQRPIGVGKEPFAPSAAISFVKDQRVLEISKRLVRALNWSGVAHIDLREEASTGTIYIIEFNPRYWNSLLGSLRVGVNFPQLSCLAALGMKFDPPDYSEDDFIVSHFRGFLTVRDSIWRYTLADPIPRLTAYMTSFRPSWHEI